jgi:hypothetical protein
MAEERQRRRIETAVAVVISIAALATSWASYQAKLWNGDQAAHYGRAGANRTTATRDAIEASVTRSVEVGLFSAWLDAKHAHKEPLAQFYAARFPPGLKPAFDEWIAQQPLTNPRAPPSPFAMESYRQPALVEARLMEASAMREFNEGLRATAVSDDYTRSAVFLATAMFFAGVGQVFDSRRVRIAMGFVALIACVAGVASMLTLPMLNPF